MGNVKLLEMEKEKFFDRNILYGANENIITFISDILFHGVNKVSASNSVESIRSLFEDGYCYYFAKILQDAFPGGDICVCHPYGHIVYIYGAIAYDIHGVSDSECELFIPIEKCGDHIEAFRHVPGKYNPHIEDEDKTIADIANEVMESKSYIIALTENELRPPIIEKSNAVISTGEINIEYELDRANFIAERNKLQSYLKDGFITKSQYIKSIKGYCNTHGLSWEYIESADGIF